MTSTSAVCKSTSGGEKMVVVEMTYVDDEVYDVDTDSDSAPSETRRTRSLQGKTGNGIERSATDSEGLAVRGGHFTSSTMPGGFRLLRAYKRPRTRKSASSATIVLSSEVAPEAVTIVVDNGALSTADVPVSTEKELAAVKPTATVADTKFRRFLARWRPKMATFCSRCLVYAKKFAAFLLSTVGLAVTTVFYAFFGGFLFSALEAPHEERTKSGVRSALNDTIMKLWNKTLDFNVLYEEEWTSAAQGILESYTVTVVTAMRESGWDGTWNADGEASKLQWSFAGALLFSVTVITTIGYGNIAPKTLPGRLATIVYATIGIPITLLSIAHVGGFLAVVFRFIYKNILCAIVLPAVLHFLALTRALISRLIRRLIRRLLRRSSDGDIKRAGSDVNAKEGDSELEQVKSEADLELEQVKIETDHEPSKSNKEDDIVVSTSVPDGGVSVTDDAPESIDVHTSSANERQDEAVSTEIVGARAHSGMTAKRLRRAMSPSELRKSISAKRQAAVARARQTSAMFFEWRRGVSRALYNDDNQQVRVPAYVSLSLIGGYILLGSMMFGFWEEKWNFWIGTYFCFVTLSTIGFGDFVPGTSLEANSWEATPRLVLCSMYLIFGLAMLAMCFELIQEEARQAFQSFGRMLGLVDDPKPIYSETEQKQETSENSEE